MGTGIVMCAMVASMVYVPGASSTHFHGMLKVVFSVFYDRHRCLQGIILQMTCFFMVLAGCVCTSPSSLVSVSARSLAYVILLLPGDHLVLQEKQDP